ncbi:hypothetical protein LTSEURB_6696 [Salmonella enterica subsp. enterica serovar Urbana str. R8-2977]|uniref:Uncharacterized protein n=1 Tax=Salmonella enterica subsp. enterica serovar Urbana str. R8-2977 TaxID=913084 RepID=G5S5B4_SALET|nr:hypothetical protein LTSEURB_6696 [Salmonella enterica subsp. enterica serovar Urbana str. R8-2977]
MLGGLYLMAWAITFRAFTVVVKNRYHGLVGPQPLILAPA